MIEDKDKTVTKKNLEILKEECNNLHQPVEEDKCLFLEIRKMTSNVLG